MTYKIKLTQQWNPSPTWFLSLEKPYDKQDFQNTPNSLSVYDWEVVNSHVRSSKSVDNPVTQASLPAERFDLRHSFYLQETIIWSSKLIFQRKAVGDSPC